MKPAVSPFGPCLLLMLGACTVTGTGHGQLDDLVPEPDRVPHATVAALAPRLV